MALDNWAEAHFEYLRKLGFPEDRVTELRAEAESPLPEYEMSQFMANSWQGVVNPDIGAGWLANTLKMLLGEELNRRDPKIEFYDESEWEELKKAVAAVVDAGVEESSLLTLIRACQKNVLGSMYRFLDGGCGGDFHLYEIQRRNGDASPGRSFSAMEEFFMAYDPKRITGNERA